MDKTLDQVAISSLELLDCVGVFPASKDSLKRSRLRKPLAALDFF
jgi:hypothetical protein